LLCGVQQRPWRGLNDASADHYSYVTQEAAPRIKKHLSLPTQRRQTGLFVLTSPRLESNSDLSFV